MIKKIKAGYYKIGETTREKEIFVVKGARILTNFRHIGGLLKIYRSHWYIVLSWFDGQCGHNDVVESCETKQKAVNIANKIVGKRTGRWKETVGQI